MTWLAEDASRAQSLALLLLSHRLADPTAPDRATYAIGDTATPQEVEAGARALAQFDGANYFEEQNKNGMSDYEDSARTVLEAALPLVARRLRTS